MAGPSQHVLVTDGVCFMGSHIVRKLLLRGFCVRVAVMSVEHESEGYEMLQQSIPKAKNNLRLVEVSNDRPGSWLTAMQGCQYVIHTSAPLAVEEPSDDDELLEVVKDFTTFLLNTAKTARISRFVLSSSPCNIFGNNTVLGRVYTEEDWADETKIHVYYKTKIIAEKECWKYVRNLRDDESFELSVVHPSIPVGPMISEDFSYSADILSQIMTRASKTLPHIQYALVDVRDAAAAHVAAMIEPGAAGHRHIVTATSLWVRQIASVIKDEFAVYGYNPIVKETSGVWMKILSWLDASYRPIKQDLGKEIKLDNTRMRNVLGIHPRDIKSSIIEACHNLVDEGYVEATPAYAESHFSETDEASTSAMADIVEEDERVEKKRSKWSRKKLGRSGKASKKQAKPRSKSDEGSKKSHATESPGS